MGTHVRHLITAYVHGQLSTEQRLKVRQHIRVCRDCREQLARDERATRDLVASMPRLGELSAGQKARLWPAILSELRTPRRERPNPLQSFGMVFAIILVCAFVSTMLFTGSAQALSVPAQPRQFIPAEVLATWTPARTDNPSISSQTPQASETANPYSIPQASPIPPVKMPK